MKKLILFLSLLIVNYSLSIASVRYVSHQGSSTPPYTSWETAADSIQKCIDYSAAGDTIYVANGVYKEKIIVQNKFLTLIGSSQDSCIVDVRDLATPSDFYAFYIEGDIRIENLRIIVSYNHTGAGFAILDAINQTYIENNKVENCSDGAIIFNSHLTFRHNLITDANTGIHLEAFNENYFPVIDSNIIVTVYNFSHGIGGSIGTSATIRNNLVISEEGGDGFYLVLFPKEIKNNLVIKQKDYSTFGYEFSLGNGIISNNSVVGKSNGTGFKLFKGTNQALNNNVINSLTGYETDQVDTIKFHYNNIWDSGRPYTGFTPDSTNIISDPMFVNQDSSDFHLQMFSPLIDAGDPAILDRDGSRSDIGLYGGPLGESYTYLDLPPRSPVNLSATVDTGYILIKWNKNTEADLGYYNLYRDTTENFPADSTTFAASIEDTFYLHIRPEGIENLYFKLTAVDSQGNMSGPSEELHIVLTGTKNNEQFTINSYRLFQNYPNPFNPTTRIGYRLKERGYVKLYVYDIKGELVETLVNKVQERGYYEVEFQGKSQKEKGKSNLASGIYLYRMEVINENHIPVFTDIRKMVFIK